MKTDGKRRIALAAATSLGLAVAGYGALHRADPAPAPDPPAPAQVDVAAVVEATIIEWADFSGRLDAVERVEIRPRVSGSIEAIHFQEGALVSQGELLFVIDPRPYAAEVRRAEAALAAAQSRIVLAEQELARAGRLLADNAIARREHEERENAAREARAGLQGAQAARLNLGYTRIVAPVSGRASRAEITVGNLVAGGADAPVLTTIVSVSPMYASFELDEQSYLKHAAGDPKRLPVFLGLANEDGHPREGRLHSVDAARRAAHISAVRYREGAVNYLGVIDAERTVLQARRLAAQIEGARTNATATLVRALGGSWDGSVQAAGEAVSVVDR